MPGKHGPRELIDVDAPAWPLPARRTEEGAVEIEVVPAAPDAARAALVQLGVTARSYLGAVVLNCGGLLVDGGWLRIFGSPADTPQGPPSFARVNAFPEAFDPGWQAEAGLVVAHDVLGGVFVLNGPDPARAGRPGDPGEVVYFAPDELRWISLGAGTRPGRTGWSPAAWSGSTRTCAGPGGAPRWSGAPPAGDLLPPAAVVRGGRPGPVVGEPPRRPHAGAAGHRPGDRRRGHRHRPRLPRRDLSRAPPARPALPRPGPAPARAESPAPRPPR
ncbi:DUF2625 family protein [Nocardiopsis composta]